MKTEIDVLISIPLNELENEHTIISSTDINLWEKGLVVSFEREVPLATLIQLTFFLPDSTELLDVKGRVMRIEKVADHFNLVLELADLKPQPAGKLGKILAGYHTGG